MKKSFTRYTASGLLFTVIGPSLLYILFPLGSLASYSLTEIIMQVSRYVVHSRYVFSDKRKYSVSIVSYICAWAPTSATGFAVYYVAREIVGRAGSVLSVAASSLIVGYLWSRFVYSRLFGSRQNA